MAIISTLYIILVLVMTMLGAFAGLFFKRASGSLQIKDLITNKNLYIGVSLYLLGAVLNIYVLRGLPYSVVLPLTSLTYIWTMCISYLFLKEKITAKKITGVCLILIGAILISLTTI